jgi:hypothetical protein
MYASDRVDFNASKPQNMMAVAVAWIIVGTGWGDIQ